MICGRLGRLNYVYGKLCSTQLQSRSSAGNPRDGTVDEGQRRGKFGKSSHSRRATGKLCIADDSLCVRSCKPGSADISGRMVNDVIARAAS